MLGFTGTEDKGWSGFEQKFNGLLRGKPGRLVAEEDPNGREIPATQRTADPAQRGGDLVLTIDQALQFEVEKQLAAGVNAANAGAGSRSSPTSRPATCSRWLRSSVAAVGAGPKPLPATEDNRPLTAVYEPGSTAKVVTVAGALEENAGGADDAVLRRATKIADRRP